MLICCMCTCYIGSMSHVLVHVLPWCLPVYVLIIVFSMCSLRLFQIGLATG